MCASCSGPLSGRQVKYCSPICASRGFNAARKSDGRLREYRKREDVKERNRERLRTAGPLATCDHCGESFRRPVVRPAQRHCGRACAARTRAASRPTKPKPEPKPVMDMRSPLRIAWEAKDWDGVQRELLARTQRHPSGCRLWTGTRDGDGYSQVKIGRTRPAAYRVMATALNKGPIGGNPVHHTCANRLCLEPRHLQVVRPHENAAEMLHRKWYEQRINDLEAALTALDPDHPLLTTLPLAC